MIEAVNAVVANSSVLRGAAEAVSAARSFAANPERVQEVAQAPYVSPYISMDLNYNKAVLQIRDGDTGDVLKQFPSEAALELRSRQIAQKAAAPVKAPTPESAQATSAPTPAPQAPAPQPEAPVNAQAQVAAAALASTQAQAAAVSAPPTSGNVVVTA